MAERQTHVITRPRRIQSIRGKFGETPDASAAEYLYSLNNAIHLMANNFSRQGPWKAVYNYDMNVDLMIGIIRGYMPLDESNYNNRLIRYCDFGNVYIPTRDELGMIAQFVATIITAYPRLSASASILPHLSEYSDDHHLIVPAYSIDPDVSAFQE